MTIFFFKDLTPLVTRYHGQLSSCKYQKKLIIQSWENLVKDVQTNRQRIVITRTRVIWSDWRWASKSIKPKNIGVPSSCKTYINESLWKYFKYLWWKCNLWQTRGSIQSFWAKNWSIRIRHQNDKVTSVTHIEGLEWDFLEDYLCDNNCDEESEN